MIESRRGLAASILAVVAVVSGLAGPNPDWTARQKPFRIAGNLYYVGSRDLAAYLVTTPAGNIVLNANLKTSPPQIRASVEELGFKWKDTRILLNSQAHYDHTAGAAQIVRETHAKVMVMAGDSEVAETGDAHDFSGDPALLPYDPVRVDRVLHDEDVVRLGGVVLHAHKTAGHTRGCTTWSLTVREDGKLLNVVIVGGFSPLSSYRLLDSPRHHASYPGIERDFEQGFAKLKSLHCDIFLGAHGVYFDLQKKLAKLPKVGYKVWIDPVGYRKLIDQAEADLKKRIGEERNKSSF